ncbi:hypothetical protein FACS189490_11440 [Clostridia bacterium]|nr:hypothetical protein FACS189490_11440 [Clostridia bacterium]
MSNYEKIFIVIGVAAVAHSVYFYSRLKKIAEKVGVVDYIQIGTRNGCEIG